ncbi:MAG: hypothetical protein U0451_00360 [Candidatus Saccharimonadales bacterium]
MFTRKSTTDIPDENAQTSADVDDNLIDLMEVLEAIDENKTAAKLNKKSIIDNKGGRIYF